MQFEVLRWKEEPSNLEKHLTVENLDSFKESAEFEFWFIMFKLH